MQLLIQMELSKFKINKYIISSILITFGMCLFTTITLLASEQDNSSNYAEVVKMMNAAILDCYLIFSSILIMKVIVEEYMKKTVWVLFTYSVNRVHLMVAKLLLVLGITVSFTVVTEIICIAYLIVVGPYMKLSLPTFDQADFVYWLTQFGWGIVLIIGFTLLCINIAFIKKTSQSVFLTSLFSIAIIQIIISQDIHKFSLVLGVLILILTKISLYKYAGKIE